MQILYFRRETEECAGGSSLRRIARAASLRAGRLADLPGRRPPHHSHHPRLLRTGRRNVTGELAQRVHVQRSGTCMYMYN